MITHISCSGSGAMSMKQAIKDEIIEGKNVLYFFDDLSNGSILDINYIDQRVVCNKKLYPKLDTDYFKEIKECYNSFFKGIEGLGNEEIYLWYGENAKEMCALMYILSLLESKLENIYIINVSEKVYEISSKIKYSPRCLGEVIPEKFIDFISLKKHMVGEIYLSYIELWARLKSENFNLRIYKDKSVVSVQEDYFDVIILQHTRKRFTPCTRTVGEVNGCAENYITDDFIFWRILELVKNNKIAFKGSLGRMKDMEIKKFNE